MNRQTRRRAVLGGLAAVAVGGASYALNRPSAPGRWLRPVASLADSPTFAFVRGVADRGADEMAVEVAMRARGESGRRVELFADAGPVEEYMPPLRSFWRFDASIREPGEYTLRVGDAALPVELLAEAPPHHGARVQLTPRVTWRSDFVAHARGYSTGDGGRVHVAFRRRTGDPPAITSVALRDPAGRVVGDRTVPAGVRELSFGAGPLRAHDADAELVALRNGREIDAVPLFYR